MPFFRAVEADRDEIESGNFDPDNLTDFLGTNLIIHNGSSGFDSLGGAVGNDLLFGNGGDDFIVSDTGDDVVIPGGGSDEVVLGLLTDFDPNTQDPIFDLASPDGSNRVEVSLTPTSPSDFANVLGFDRGAGADQDFIVLTAPGANPTDLGISKVTLTSGLRLQDAGSDANVLNQIFNEVDESLATQGVDLSDDLVEVVLVTDNTDTAVIHLDVSDPNTTVATPLVNLVDVSNLTDLENQILYSTPTV